jgi:hypothetical protein
LRTFGEVVHVESVEAYFTAATQRPAALAERAQSSSALQLRNRLSNIGHSPQQALLTVGGYLCQDAALAH